MELVDVEGRDDAAALPSVLVDEVLGRTGRGVARVEEPVEDQHEGQRRVRSGVVELGHVVDDVHEPGFLGHEASFLVTAGGLVVRVRGGSTGRAHDTPRRPGDDTHTAGPPGDCYRGVT